MGFVTALQLVKLLEGGKVDNAADPGGRTNCGVTQATWEQMGFKGDVFNAHDQQIGAVYYRLWMDCKATDPMTQERRSLFCILPDPADAFAFQIYINLPGHFIRVLQHAVGVDEDGTLGPISMRALDRPSPMELANALADAQLHYYAHIRHQDEFTEGLKNRVERAKRFLEM